MMRNLFTAGIALAAAHQAHAQNAKTIEIVASTALTTEHIATATITFTAAQADSSSEPVSELSSRIGPFYETLMFMPGMNGGHFLSAIASGGNNDETTTFVGFEPSYVTDSAWTEVETKTTLAYATITWAPSTYMEMWTEQ